MRDLLAPDLRWDLVGREQATTVDDVVAPGGSGPAVRLGLDEVLTVADDRISRVSDVMVPAPEWGRPPDPGHCRIERTFDSVTP